MLKSTRVYKSGPALKLAVAVAACVPVAAGLAGVIIGPALLGHEAFESSQTDSHFRYLSGILFAIGIGFWSTIGDIENKTMQFRLLTLLVVTGGLSRLYAFISMDEAQFSLIFALVMELAVTPSLAVWQGSVARHHARDCLIGAEPEPI